MKTVAQFSSVRKGVLDLSLYPISYARGEFAELNIGLMPGLVSSYKQGAAWKQAEVGQKFSQFLPARVSSSCLGSASRRRGEPRHAGSSIPRRERSEGAWRQPRNGHGAAAAGATTLSTPSNELYAAMQTGAAMPPSHPLPA